MMQKCKTNTDQQHFVDVNSEESQQSSICRVGKCHGYDGYIRVKKLPSWGKKFGRPK